MISKPTVPQLLQTMKVELAEKIAPALTDPTHTVAVTMMGAILDAISVRVENELAWMREESAAIEAAAAEFVARHPSSAAVADALDQYRSNVTDSLRLSAAQADYDRASEVLSCLADAAYGMGDSDGVAAVERLVDQRLATELAIVGTFVAAGRD
jgi:hypothetical protein